jgi:hypothetical protein
MPSTRRATALAMIAAFEDLDVEKHLSLRAPNCTHLLAPDTAITQPPFSNSDFETHLMKLRGVIEQFPVWPKEVMEDEQQNRVIVWATGQPTFRKELRDDGLTEEEWVYKGEYIFIFSMDESGEKIERVVEFLDSKAVVQVRALVQRASANLERKNKTA